MNEREYRAAGGIVLDSSGRVLLIERDVVRDNRPVHEVRLPKGHVEPGETDLEAALREVCEETGYCSLAVLADLGEEANDFVVGGERVIRTEHYFLMRLTSLEHQAPRSDDPNSEETLFRSRWSPSLAAAANELTYESERRFVRAAMNAQPAGSGSLPEDDQGCVSPISGVLSLETIADLQALQAECGSEIIVAMIETYLLNTPERLLALNKAAADADMPALIWTAHSLKGSSGVFGAHRMVELCDRLQHFNPAHGAEELSTWLGQLAAEFELVREELAQLKAASAGAPGLSGDR